MRGIPVRRASLAAVIAVSVAGFGPAHAGIPAASNPHVVPGRALVRFAPGTNEALRMLADVRAGATVVRSIDAIGYREVAFSSPVDTVLASYRSDPAVLVAEPVYRGMVALTPSDACLGTACDGIPAQWHLAMTNAPFAWDRYPGRTFTASTKPGAVTIAVLDTHIDRTNPDFVNAAGSSPDARDGGQLDVTDARDWVDASHWNGAAAYHGTFVAGLAAASAGNARDVAGLGYAARVMPLTVVDGGGNTDAAALADAIVYAWQHGARIINLSLGILGDSHAVHDAIRLVTGGASPALVVAAAGNNTGSAAFYPGSYPEVMSVTGTDQNDRHASCANYNANVSVAAPADRLYGLTVMPTEIGRAPCGTSAAAPQVSALAAMLMMQDPSRTPAQVRAIIERTADDLGAAGRDDQFGYGRIDAARALASSSAGPSAILARATVIGNGGTSTVTATATSAKPITAAQIIFDRPDASPIAMQPADGAWGGTTERLVASLHVPAGLAGGPHPVWVRAFDGTWGAPTVGVLGIDTVAPAIVNPVAQNGVRATGQPMTITFGAIDDYSDIVSYGVEVRATATGAVTTTIVRNAVAAGGQTVTWSPDLTVAPGHYSITIAVVDAVGNISRTQIGALLA